MALLDVLEKNAYNQGDGNVNLATVDTWISQATGSSLAQYESTIIPALPTIPNVSLTGYQLFYFISWFKKNFTVYLTERDFGTEFDSKLITSLVGLYYAQGTLAGGYGIGFVAQQIRPITMYATPSGAAVQTWIKTAVSAGWVATVFAPLLGNTSSVSSNMTLFNTVIMVIFGIADFDVSAKVTEYQFKTPTQSYGVKQMYQSLYGSSISLKLLEQDILLPLNANGNTIDLKYESSGSSIPVPVGIQFVTLAYSVLE